MSNRTRWSIGLFVLLVITLILILSAYQYSGVRADVLKTPHPTYTPDPTSTLKPSHTPDPTPATPTQEPTMTPDPTATLPATYTPIPTPTDVPTDTPNPTPRIDSTVTPTETSTHEPTSTYTPIVTTLPTGTVTPTSTQATATATATQEQETQTPTATVTLPPRPTTPAPTVTVPHTEPTPTPVILSYVFVEWSQGKSVDLPLQSGTLRLYDVATNDLVWSRYFQRGESVSGCDVIQVDNDTAVYATYDGTTQEVLMTLIGVSDNSVNIVHGVCTTVEIG